MEIIKGLSWGSYPKIVVCKRCKTVFSYERQDVYIHKGVHTHTKLISYTEETWFYTGAYEFVQCPVCEDKVKIRHIGSYSEKQNIWEGC